MQKPFEEQGRTYHIDCRITFGLTVIALIFLGLTLLAHLILGAGTAELVGFEQFLDVDSEANLPTWYAAALLHFAALIAWMISDQDRINLWHWRVIAFLLIVMGIDEIASIHNTPSRRLGEFLGTREGIMMNAWVIPGSIVCMVVALTFFQFLLRQPSWLRVGLGTAAGLFVIGAIGLEMVGSVVEYNAGGLIYDGDEYYSLAFETIAVGEEAFEYAGVILTIHLFLRRARELNARFSLVV